MLPPELSAKYQERGALGSGAMGVVVEALDRHIERRVAIKLMQHPPADDTQAREAHARFRREAQAAGRLTHPNIVGLYEYGENAECSWIVMELVEGATLKAHLDRGERFPLAEIVRLMDQILGALAYSHARGVVHRDIKPGNIMLAPDGTGGMMVKIADFGIARLENSSMTQVGTVMGTPSTMAPEQFRGETVDSRADLWAAGVVLYQLLTGEKPFEGGYAAVMHKALHTEPPPPSQLAVTCPRAFDAVLARALAKRPADRYATAADFALAVRAAAAQPADASGMLASDETIDNLRPRPMAPPLPSAAAGAERGARRPIPMLALGGVAGLAAVAAAWLMLSAPSQPPAPTVAVAAPVAPPLPLQTQPQIEPPATSLATAVATETAPTPPPAPPPPSPRAVAEAVMALPCGLIRAEVGEDSLTISGLLPRDQMPELLRMLEASRIVAERIGLGVVGVDARHCDLLEQLRRLAASGEPQTVLVGTLPLQKNEAVRFDVSMPDRAGLLSADYVLATGQVFHMVQGAAVAPRSQRRFADRNWVVDAPYGVDLLVTVASDRPLFARPRPVVERVDDWLGVLAPALRQAEAQGGQVRVSTIAVPTRERR